MRELTDNIRYTYDELSKRNEKRSKRESQSEESEDVINKPRM